MPEHPQALRETKLQEAREAFSRWLDQHSHRKTVERFAILEEIYSRNDHFDVESLYMEMKSSGYRVSRATVYNTLDLLVESRLVIKHQFGNQQARYEKAYGFRQHHHLICLDCSKVMEFCDPRMAEIQDTVGQLFETRIVQHSLVFYGNCQKTECPDRLPRV